MAKRKAKGKRAPAKSVRGSRSVKRRADAEEREAIKALKRREREYDDWLYEGYEVEMSVDLYTGE